MKLFTKIAIGFLAFVAFIQAVRFALGWSIVVNGYVIPVWLSAAAALLVGGLAFMLWKESRHG